MSTMRENDAALLRGAAIPTAVVGVIAVVVGALVASGKGALGAFFGASLVIGFFSVSAVVVGRASRGSAYAAMNAALLTYTVKILVLFGLIVAFKDATWFDTKVFGLTIVACTVVWTVFEVRTFGKLKMVYVDPDRTDRF